MTKLWLLCTFVLVPAFGKSLSRKLAEEVKDTVKYQVMEGPKDGEVCFSPDEDCDIKFVKFIQSAKKSLDIAVYDVTHPKIVHEILVAAKRMPVRVLVDRRQSKGEHSLVSTLIKGGADVRFGVQRGIMHHKFTILDGTRLETGSFNYTVGASAKNQENQIYLSDKSVVGRYQTRFEQRWNDSARSLANR